MLVNIHVAESPTMQAWKRCVVLLAGFLMLQGPAWSSETEYNLGVYAYRAKDYAGARQHWQKAVVEGEVSAMNNLGFLLFNALGGPRDETRAVSLWTTAAKKGHTESQWHLGEALEQGKGSERDVVEAYAWYRCAVAGMQSEAQDEEDRAVMTRARNDMIRVLGRLPEDRVTEAEMRARDYVRRFTARDDASEQGGAVK